ncbi:MAG TPA: spore germination protein GerW family protein [Candidatus Cloacimonas sp.]|nr:MAG: Sporulation protein YtfJ (Spore_YtfJ) [Candidatus Cloacimonetes bacterium ADurb.Bin089]HQO18666.1 spore germination protein GerW family protein [Candidatus Cloacimonas sp.]
MEIKEILAQIRTIVNNTMGGGFSFGQPSKLGDLYVIPVARVIYGMGGGADETTPEKEKPEEENSSASAKEKQKKVKAKVGFSGGGGIGLQSVPVGLFSIKEDHIKFHPVISFFQIMVMMSISALFILIRKKLKYKK